MRGGASQRTVARDSGVSLATVQLWLRRAGDQPLDEVDWSTQSRRPHHDRRTPPDLEDLVLALRTDLREHSVLGEYGAAAIRRRLDELGVGSVPRLRTINRILARRGALDARRRVRRAAPPAGWYLPDVAAHRAELDSFDVVEKIRLLGGVPLDVLTAVSVHGGLPGAWPEVGLSAVKTVAAMAAHWQAVGLPAYAQFDNDARFAGGMHYPESIGRVIRFCLGVGVVPVFVPPRETGFQAAVEAFNGRWQRLVWARHWSPTLADVRTRNDAWIAAFRARYAVRIDSAPARSAYPATVDLDAPPRGRLTLIRRTDDAGGARILGRLHPIDAHWIHRLVRAEVDLDARRLRVYALRRAAPDDQPQLVDRHYAPPERWYR